MHHAALDRARTHDRHFDDEIVILARAQSRQHGHLRARFDLKDADRLRATDHVVGFAVFSRYLAHGARPASGSSQQLERFAHGRQHPECKNVHFEQAERFEIILVPLNHGTFRHRGVLDRDELADRLFRDHESADVLRQVTGEVDELSDAPAKKLNHGAIDMQAVSRKAGLKRLEVVPVGLRLRQSIDDIELEPQCFANVANGAARSIADDRRRQRGSITPVLLEDVLNDLLAALVLEVDIDIGRFIALLADEALEKHIDELRIHLRDAERIADHGVRGGAAALMQDVPASGFRHDFVHSEKERFVLELGDQRELSFHVIADLFRHAVRPSV